MSMVMVVFGVGKMPLSIIISLHTTTVEMHVLTIRIFTVTRNKSTRILHEGEMWI